MTKHHAAPGISGRIFGLETEYGLLVQGSGPEELMEESRLLVAAYPGVWAGPWDYRSEDPRRDTRGFRVDHLSYDHTDAAYDRPDRGSHLTGEQQRSDRVLANGARLYNDHGHPEYSTPECRSLRDLVAHDRAGERIILECARLREREIGRAVSLFKNNTDFHGASYGCHENYLCRRDVPFEKLLNGLLPFLVTRILFAGAGKTGVETGGGPLAKECLFQLSQRADFFTEIASVDTLAKRPIFNTRDEPHADPRLWRRLHVICGDANLSEFATALKVGTTSLVLDLIESGWEPLFRLRDPVKALQSVSRDPSFRWLVELDDGRTLRATDLQRIYLRDAQALLAGGDVDTDWTLREWERVLADLDRDPFAAEDRLDWVAKRKLLETYIEAEGLWWEDPALRSLDLAYHDLDADQGLYAALEEAGQIVRLVDEERITCSTQRPPSDTRAAVRGELVRRFGPEAARIGWSRVGFKGGDRPHWAPLPVELGSEGVSALLSRLGAVKTVPEALRCLREESGEVDDPQRI